jgi:ubiquinone/menaquinone biosynthesis C-methylase UbiE
MARWWNPKKSGSLADNPSTEAANRQPLAARNGEKSMTASTRLRIATLTISSIALLATTTAEVCAQKESVRPGINDSFRNPDLQVDEWVKRFEGESREVYDKRKQIVAALGIASGMKVADVGAGTGLFTRLFAHEVGSEGKVYAVDIAPKMIEHIRSSAAKLHLTQIKAQLGTDYSVELPENSIALAFICDTYHHFEYPERMIRSIHRSLKPGGRVALIDFVREEQVSSDWVLKHVRAGQKQVEKEITACGFRKIKQVDGLLKENYYVLFEKIPSGSDRQQP